MYLFENSIQKRIRKGPFLFFINSRILYISDQIIKKGENFKGLKYNYEER